MRTIGVVTVARSDYGIYLPLLRRMQKDRGVCLHLYVSGTHLSKRHDQTVGEIIGDGFEVTERIPVTGSGDSPMDIARAMGKATLGFASAYAKHHPDLLVVLGDRFEMHAAATAAIPFKIPVAHLHGGELTEGAFDDSLRHSITKLSHLHLVSTPVYRDRILQLGEEPWRVHLCGSLSLTKLSTLRRLSKAEMEQRFKIRLSKSPLLVTFHPVTLQFEQTEWQVRQLLAALHQIDLPVVFTAPNTDTRGSVVHNLLKHYVHTHPDSSLVDNFGSEGYFNMMRHACAMVGNSSSGILEAPSFKLPVVNIGIRQKGRVRAGNVLDVGHSREDIIRAIRKALQPAFKRRIESMTNPYSARQADKKILRVLREAPLNDRLIIKKFVDQE